MDLPDEGWGDMPSQPKQSDKEQSKSSLTVSPPLASPPPSATSNPRSPNSRGPRSARRTEAQKLDVADDPLGPLGMTPVEEPEPSPMPSSIASPVTTGPPVPPQKENRSAISPGVAVRPGTAGSTSSSLRGMMDSVNLNDSGELPPGSNARVPPPVQPPSGDTGSVRSGVGKSMSVEQAAKPKFEISVGDPHKVGDLTSSHTEYQVKTRTTSKAYRQPDFLVSRRYRDFLWLYNQLHSNNPGVVVPPPPEKQAVGRFESEFVEHRRSALERMLNKIAAHPILQHDADLKLFLESETFNMDVKHKERGKEPALGESKGMLSTIGINVGGGGKFVEHDDWFHDRKIYLDALESQLNTLYKAIQTVTAQRKALATSALELSNSLGHLSSIEISPSLSNPLADLSAVQLRIRDLYDRQATQDTLTLGIVIDEYIRLIGSVREAFHQRQKAYHTWHTAENELQKRRNTQEKLLRQGRSQRDRLDQVSAEVNEAERRVNQARLLFEDLGRLMRAELERFEREKVEDFKGGLETYLEGAVEAQKELIELWETYLMQLDAEEDGAPFALAKPPVGVHAAAADEEEPPTPLPPGQQLGDDGLSVAETAVDSLQ